MADVKKITLPDGTELNIAMAPMTGATSSAAGSSGAVPAPSASEKDKYLRGDGTWATPSGGGGGGTNLDEEPCSVTFGTDTITEVFSSGTKTTTFNSDGSITETWPDGATLVTVFNADGSITRTLAS